MDFQLGVGATRLFRAEKHSRAADIFGRTSMPTIFSHKPIFHRQMKIETFGAQPGEFLPAFRYGQ